MAKRRGLLRPKTLVVTNPARADIDGVLAYITERADLDTALRFADAIDAKLARVAWLGHSGVARDWISPGLRMTVLGNYCIYFRVTDRETIILRFRHSARDVTQMTLEQLSDDNDGGT